MASPFYLWSTLTDFFTTAAGPINGDLWDTSNIDDGGSPIIVDDATSATGFVAGQVETYTIYLTSQDWIGTQQPTIVVATTKMVNLPGVNGSDNLAAATILSTSGDTGKGAVFYWAASTTNGDYALKFQPITTIYVDAPSAGPNTNLTGSPTTLLPAVQTPLGWNFATFGATSTQAAEIVYEYTTAASATTENVYLLGINASGGLSTSAPILVATLADQTWHGLSTSSSDASFNFSYAQSASGGMALYNQTFDPFTGALGAASLYLSLPGYASVTGEQSNDLSSGTRLRFHEGVLSANSQAVIQDSLGNGTASEITTIDLSSASDPFSTTAVNDPGDGYTDYTVLAYSDSGKVHLDLFNASGVEIGSDFVVPGITSFDRIHTLSGGDNARVEIDYTVTDPNGGDEVEGLIYDTASAGYVYTLSGGGEYIGSTFDDTVTDAAGTYVVDGGGGADTFVVPEDADEVTLAVNASGEIVVSTYDSTTFNSGTLIGTATLIGFTSFKLEDVEVTVMISNGYTTVTISAGGTVEFVGASSTAWALSLASGANVLLVDSAWRPINGTGAAIDLSSSQASIAGGADAIAFVAGSGDAASLYATDNAWDGVTGSAGVIYLTSAQTTVTGGGDAIDFAGGTGNAVGLYSTNNAWDGISGSNGAIYLTNAQTTVTGGGDAVYFSAGTTDSVGLYGTNGDWDGVSGSGGTVYLVSSQSTVTGGSDVVYLSGSGDAVGLYGTSNRWDGVFGSSSAVYATSSQTTVAGGSDAIYLYGSDDAVGLSATNGSWDGVFGSDSTIYLSSAQSAIAGGSNAIYLFGSGNELGLSGTDQHWDGVSGSGATIYLSSAQTAVTGGGDAMYLSGTGDAVGLYGTNGTWDGVSGADSTVYLTSAQTTVSGGGGDTVNFSGGSGNAVGLSGTAASADTVNGSKGTVYVQGSQATINGGDDALYLSGSSTATISGSSDAFVFQQGIGGLDKVGGFGATDSMQFSHLDFATWAALQSDTTQAGSNAVITLNASDSVTILGVQKTSLAETQFHLV